jgi:hypothetical protein
MSNCTSCHAPIIWGTTASGKPLPLDPAPAETGNLAVRPGEAGTRYVRYLTLSGQPEPDEWRAVSHFATCPNASMHRKSS